MERRVVCVMRDSTLLYMRLARYNDSDTDIWILTTKMHLETPRALS